MTQRILCKVNIVAVEGKDLPQMDLGGSCDSILQIVIGHNSRKTKPVMKSLNPVWNEQFDVEIYDLNTPVEFTVLDWDRLSRNDVVGHCKLNLTSLPPGKNDLWLGLGQVKDKNPHVHVVVEILPRIHVKLVEAKDLPSSDLFGGQSDPYVEFAHLKNVKRSATVKKTLNPTWNEDFDFDIHDLNSPLMVQVFDWDLGSKSDLLGKCVVTMTSLKMGNNDIWLSLPTKGSVHLIIDALGFGSYDPNKGHVQPIQQSQQNLHQNVQELSVKREEFVQMNTHVDTKPIVNTTVVTHTVSVDQKPVEHHTNQVTQHVTTVQHGDSHSTSHSKDEHHDSHSKDGHKDHKDKDHKDKDHKHKDKDGKKKDKKDKGEKKDKKHKKDKKDKKAGSSDSSSSSDSD